jgi:hypothetical protein
LPTFQGHRGRVCNRDGAPGRGCSVAWRRVASCGAVAPAYFPGAGAEGMQPMWGTWSRFRFACTFQWQAGQHRKSVERRIEPATLRSTECYATDIATKPTLWRGRTVSDVMVPSRASEPSRAGAEAGRTGAEPSRAPEPRRAKPGAGAEWCRRQSARSVFGLDFHTTQEVPNESALRVFFKVRQKTLIPKRPMRKPLTLFSGFVQIVFGFCEVFIFFRVFGEFRFKKFIWALLIVQSSFIRICKNVTNFLCCFYFSRDWEGKEENKMHVFFSFHVLRQTLIYFTQCFKTHV